MRHAVPVISLLEHIMSCSSMDYIQYGCCYYEWPGKTVTTETGGHVHVFSYISQ